MKRSHFFFSVFLITAIAHGSYAQDKKPVIIKKANGNSNPKAESNSIDKIFEAQESNAKPNHSVDAEVLQSMSESKRMVQAQQEAKRREAELRARENERYAQATLGNEGNTYACSVTCTGSWWASGANVHVVLKAPNEEKAREFASEKANPLCKSQTNTSGVFNKTALSSGSAKCEQK